MALDPPLPVFSPPPLGFRFLVAFFHPMPDIPVIKGIPNSIDVYFRSVAGLGSTIELQTIEEGGRNLFARSAPLRVEHEPLKLERGLVKPSLVSAQFEMAMQAFKVQPSHVLVALLNSAAIPIYAYLLYNALPRSYRLSEWNAENEGVVIETMELVYQYRRPMDPIAGPIV